MDAMCKLEHQLALCTQTEVILTTGVDCKKKGASLCAFCTNTIYFLEWFLSCKIGVKEHAQENPVNPVLAGWTSMCPGAGEEGMKAHLDKRPG